MSAVSTRGILLRSHPYSESSRVLRFLTEDLGIVGVMARGVRTRSGKGGGGIDLFAESDLTLHLRPNRDLQTLTSAEVRIPRRGLGAHPLRLAAAGVLAEIVLRHHDEGPGDALYPVLSASLDRLEQSGADDIVPVLLVEGWRVVESFGFLPMLDPCVRCGRPLGPDEMGRFDLDSGGVLCSDCGAGRAGPRIGPGGRRQLGALLEGEIPEDLRRLRGHLRLLADFIVHHLAGGRPLDAFPVLWRLLPPEPDPPPAPDPGAES